MSVLSRVAGWYRPYHTPLRVVVVHVVSAARAIEATYRRLLGKPPHNREVRCHCLAIDSKHKRSDDKNGHHKSKEKAQERRSYDRLGWPRTAQRRRSSPITCKTPLGALRFPHPLLEWKRGQAPAKWPAGPMAAWR